MFEKMALGFLLAAFGLTVVVTAQLDCECGRSKLATRIVGGREAEPNKYPWMAGLIMASRNHQFCAGALINDRYILTASHCMAVPMSDMRVALGAHNIKEKPPVMVGVEEIIKHENYIGQEDSYKWDIALLKLDQPVQFTEDVQPVCLSPESLQGFDNLVGAGWGKTAWGGKTSNVLLEVDLTEVAVPDCQRSHKSRVNQNHVCTLDPGKSVCQGDSGGPLVTKQNNRYYQAGIVSWGIRCGDRNNFPAVFTRVSSYLDWIAENTDDAQWCRNPRPAPVAAAPRSGRFRFGQSRGPPLFRLFQG